MASYVDDIKVKIAERYKPPPRISIPMSYSQRVILSRQTQGSSPSYGFQLEKSVLERMKKLKNSRKSLTEERKQRLDQSRQAFNKKIEEEKSEIPPTPPKTPPPEEPSTSTPVSYSSQNFNGILMPTPALNPIPSNYNPTQSFNLSDFENDTSSPFDNMELKSMNDLEELAQVLKTNYNPAFEQKTYNLPQSNNQYSYGANQYSYSNLPNYSPYSNYNYVPSTSSNYNGYYTTPSAFNPPKTNCKSVPDLVKSVEKELHLNDKDSTKRPKSTDAVYPKKPDVLAQLSQEERDLCRNVSVMGFPLERVARVCGVVGGDQKKIVDHLIALSELLDLGFSEKDASDALLKNNNDRDKALDLLIS